MLPPPAAGVGVLEALAAEGEGPRATLTVAVVRPEARGQTHKVLKYARRAGLGLVGLHMAALDGDDAAALDGGAHGAGWAGLVRRGCVAALLERAGACVAVCGGRGVAWTGGIDG
jgi:hypothetical protein